MAINTPKLNPNIYKSIASNHLVVYSIYSLHNDGDEITSEDIIAACFTLFPKKFSLKQYPQWPDSALIGRRLNDCRGKGLIAAKTDPEFKLTAKGSRLAEKVAMTLGVAIPTKIKLSHPKKIVGSLVRKAGTMPVKKALPAPVLESSKIEQEQKIEVEQKVILPAPVVKAHSVKQKKKVKAKSAKKVLSVPVIEMQKVKPKPKAEVEKGNLPVAKVSPAKQKRITSTKKILTAPVIETPKIIQGQKTEAEQEVVPPVPVIKTHRVKQQQTAPAKKALPIPVIEMPKFKQEKKEEIKQRVVPPAPVAITHPVKQKRAAHAKKALPVPVVKTPKVTQERKAEAKQKVVSPAPIVITHPTKQKRATTVKKVLPIPAAEAPKVRQEVKEKVVPPLPIAIVRPTKQKRTAPANKTMPVPVAETLVARQEKGVQPAVPAIVISQEAKMRAGKFVRMMETSDAYVHYKKNGACASINEFDFRSLLLCTMESSPETLARNVELFKGYAGVHNRKDLIAFLIFCKDKFLYLFTPQKKTIREAK